MEGDGDSREVEGGGVVGETARGWDGRDKIQYLKGRGNNETRSTLSAHITARE